METKKEVVISIPRTAKSSSAAAPPSLLSGMTPPSPPGEPLALKNQTRQVGPQPHQMPQQPQWHHQPQQPYRHQYHHNQQGGPHHRNPPPPNNIMQRRPSAIDTAPPSFSSSRLPQYSPPMINVNAAAIPQPLPPLSDAQKKTLRHLDTLVEVVSKKIADQMESNKKMDVIPTDPSGGIVASSASAPRREVRR